VAPRGEAALTWRGRSPGCAEELEEAVRRLRAEEDAESVAAALRAELGARLQREKAADMMEARELRGLAEGLAGRDCDLQDPPGAEEESEYTADVQCVACSAAATTKAVAGAALGDGGVVHVAGRLGLYERVDRVAGCWRRTARR